MRQLRIIKKPTFRDSDSLNKYLQEVSKIDLLTTEEEIELAYKVNRGDDNALNKLVRANLRFVISVAKQYQNQGLTLPDLINEGNVGLIKAARRFDETKGFKFISYAVWWIRQSILQAIAEQSHIVRLPINKINMVNRVNNMVHDLEQKLERKPSIEEVAKELSLDSAEVFKILNNAREHLSMDAPISDESENNLYDILLNKDGVLPENLLIKESLQIEIKRILSTLKKEEAKIIRLHYGLDGEKPHTLTEIGEMLHLSKERVRQIKASAIGILKTKSDILRKYL